MSVELYTRNECTVCNRFKNLLRQYGVEYKEHIIGESVDRETVISMFPGRTKLPIICTDVGIFTAEEAEPILNEYKQNFGKQLLTE